MSKGSQEKWMGIYAIFVEEPDGHDEPRHGIRN